MTLGQHLLEASVEDELCRLVGEQQRDDDADGHHHQPVVEDQPFQPIAGGAIEILRILHDRHVIYFSRSNRHFRSPCFNPKKSD